MIGAVAAVLLLVAVFAAYRIESGLQHQSNHLQPSNDVASELEAQTKSRTSSTGQESGRSIVPSRSRPSSHSANQESAAAGSARAEQILQRLSALETNLARITPERAAEVKSDLKDLAAQGTNAIPAIRQFLARNVDYSFEDGSGAASIGYSSLRSGLFDALHQIGGLEATGVFLDTLRATADPAEIASIAHHLEELAPGQYRNEAVAAARETLDQTLRGELKPRDTGPLFQVLQSYGDAAVSPDLQKSMSQWNNYAAIALTGLPQGQGIPAVAESLRDSSQMTLAQRSFALQMLAQNAAQNEQAASTLLDQVQHGQVPDRAWVRIAEGLAGDQLQLVKPESPDGSTGDAPIPGLKRYHVENGNQNYYSLPFDPATAPEQAALRRSFLDRLINAAQQNPIALDALQRARGKLGP